MIIMVKENGQIVRLTDEQFSKLSSNNNAKCLYCELHSNDKRWKNADKEVKKPTFIQKCKKVGIILLHLLAILATFAIGYLATNSTLVSSVLGTSVVTLTAYVAWLTLKLPEDMKK